MQRHFFILLVAVIATVPSAAFAQTDVIQQAKDAGKGFRAIAPQEVAAAKAELQAAVADLDALLNRSLPDYNAGWRKFLRWDDLQTQLRAEGPDTKTAEAVLDKLSANSVGIETPRFARVRHALRNYLELATAAADAKLQETYGTQVTDFPAKLESYDKTGAGDDALAINRTLGFLRRGRQASQLADAVQAKYGKPNLIGTASQHFLAAGVEEDIEQTQPVSDNILGTSITERLT